MIDNNKIEKDNLRKYRKSIMPSFFDLFFFIAYFLLSYFMKDIQMEGNERLALTFVVASFLLSSIIIGIVYYFFCQNDPENKKNKG